MTSIRFVTGVRYRLAEFIRQPTTVALLVVLPPLVIETFGVAMETFPALPGLETAPGTAGRLTGAVFAVAVLAGLIGLFQVISARSGDERLLCCGYPRPTLLATRLVAVVAVALVSTLVAFAVFAWRIEVTIEAPFLALLALLIAGLIYALLGVVIGTVLPRELEGSLVLVFLVDIDLVFSSGLFDVDTALVDVLPMYHPHALFEAAVTDGAFPSTHLYAAIAYLLGILIITYLAYIRTAGSAVRTTGNGGASE